jgi:Asp-tRNA(Asn)/Glu-tRNA(Gln) amidotransferase A subunit family amidase
LVNDTISRIQKYNPEINAIVSLDSENHLIELARQTDLRIQKNKRKSPLDGIPILLKDNMVTDNLPTTCASKMLSCT